MTDRFRIPLAPAGRGGPSQIERLHRANYPEPDLDLDFVPPHWTSQAEHAEAVETSAPEATKDAATDAANLPPLIEPCERDLRAEVTELCQPILDYLSAFVIIEVPDNFEDGYHKPMDTSKPPQPQPSPEAEEFKARKVDLAAQFGAWLESLVEFLTVHRAWTVAEFREQHAEAWRQAREQEAIVDGIVAEHDQSVSEMRKARAALGRANLLYRGHDTVKPNLDTLPSQADLDAWKAENSRLKMECDNADQTVNLELDRQHSLRLRHEQARIKLATLKKSESDLRAKISGQVIPVMGLEQEPEL